MLIHELIEALRQFNQDSLVRVRYETYAVRDIEAVVPIGDGEPQAGGVIEIIVESG